MESTLRWKIAIGALFFLALPAFGQDLPAKPQPQPAITRHNKLWTTLEIASIFAATSADAASTCHALTHGGTEENIFLGPHPSCKQVWGFSIGAGAYWTFVHLATRHFGSGIASHIAIPIAAGIIHGYDAAHNWRQ